MHSHKETLMNNNIPFVPVHRALAAFLIAIAASNAWPQQGAAGPVLKGREVTTDNLVDALTPDTTRSLGVQRTNLPKPSASLLITFETNSADLTKSAKRQLDVVGAALQNNRLAEYSFNVEGHADPRGSSDANLLLSQQRADSVRNYLVSQHGIAAERLKAEGKGDRDLLKPTSPAAPENRRVTIVTNVR
jgi:OmpA-OmpF porin, OOP family